MNFFLKNESTSPEFLEKLQNKEQLKYFRQEKNMAKVPIRDKSYPFHLKLLRLSDLNLCIGHFIKVEIPAGGAFSVGVEVSKPNSIINISYRIEEMDL
jgi:hypothetical protein